MVSSDGIGMRFLASSYTSSCCIFDSFSLDYLAVIVSCDPSALMGGIPSCDFTISSECCMPNSKVFRFFRSTFYFKVMVDCFFSEFSSALVSNGSITFVSAILPTGLGLLEIGGGEERWGEVAGGEDA